MPKLSKELRKFDRYPLAAQEELLEHWRGGALRLPIAERCRFEDLPRLLDDLGAGRLRGKAVLKID